MNAPDPTLAAPAGLADENQPGGGDAPAYGRVVDQEGAAASAAAMASSICDGPLECQ